VGCVIVGCVLGIATDNLAVLFTGRVFEGIGLGLVGVSAPAAISIWFPAARRGGPLGIWATWMPIGMVISFTACPAIATALSWQTVWWLNIAIAVVAFILFAFFFKLPEGASEEEVVITAPVKECFATLKNPSIWFLGISFMLFCFYMLGVVNTYFNTFLAEPVEQGGWGMDAISAGLVTSVMTWLPLVAQPVFGFIYDYVGRRKMWLCISFILLLIGSATAWTSGNWGFLWIFLIVANLGGAFAGSAARPLAPDLMPPTALGATMGMVILQVFMNLGAAIGSPIFAGVLEATGHSWQVTGLAVLLPVLALGLVFAALVKWNPPHRFGTRGARKAAGSEQGISPEV
jgi:MFS family permease